jgi:hypothetical protein
MIWTPKKWQEWYRWFAWYPVRLSDENNEWIDQMVWLQWVERNGLDFRLPQPHQHQWVGGPDGACVKCGTPVIR